MSPVRTVPAILDVDSWMAVNNAVLPDADLSIDTVVRKYIYIYIFICTGI